MATRPALGHPPVHPSGFSCSSLAVVIVRPTRYDEDGYVVRHWRGTLPSNKLSCLNGLTEDAVASGALGSLSVTVHTFDEAVDRIDPRRIVFLGPIDHQSLVRLYQVSAAHVYLTVPFVLSWSLLEAMASGCLVIGSRTAPVEEVLADGRNGVLVDFFDAEELASNIADVIDRPQWVVPLRAAARSTIERRFERRACLARQMRILRAVMNRGSGRASAGLG